MTNVRALRTRQNGLHEQAPVIADKLRISEKAIDTSISHIAGLTAMLVETRMEANLSAVVGQDILTDLGNALNTVIRGRASIVSAHHNLAATGKTLRLPETAVGGMDLKPA